MIIYGWNSKTIKQAPLENLECPSCKQQNSVLAIFSKYVHIFWIPLFPYKKEAVIVCSNCEFTLREKDLDGDKKGKIKEMKKAVRTPVYLFSGLILIALAIGYFSYAGGKSKELEQAYLETPMEGDIYKLINENEESAYKYYLWKVAIVEGDSVFVSPNSFNYDGLPTKLEPEDGFYNVSYSIHKSQLLEMYEQGEIKKVIRDYDGGSSGFDKVVAYPLIDTLTNDQ